MQPAVMAFIASGYLSPLPLTGRAAYGISYTQVQLTSVPQNFSYRFSTVNYGDGLYLRFPDNMSATNGSRIPVTGDQGVLVIGLDTQQQIARVAGTSNQLCIAGISSVWAGSTEMAGVGTTLRGDIVGPQVTLMVQTPRGSVPFVMEGF
jgi:hypothetical protein